jgi:spore cortex formation protein SpoVR/YcgB (stage V sporulation)
VSEIHDELGYKAIRTLLARSRERINYVPQIVVEKVDFEGDRVLHLRYDSYRDRALDEDDAALVMEHVHELWGYGVLIKD